MKLLTKLALTVLLIGGLAALLRWQRATPIVPVVSSSVVVDEEAELMDRAQRALAAGNTDEAFSVLYEQATKFPKGRLSAQRELTHLLTLCRAGKRADARDEAASFLAQHSDSTLVPQVKAACPESP